MTDMWRFSYSTLKREVLSASSYINKKGEHPKTGTCISPEKVIFGDVKMGELKDDEWKLLVDTSAVKSGIRSIGIFDDTIYIVREEYLMERDEYAKI